jgi:hypothetical protein
MKKLPLKERLKTLCDIFEENGYPPKIEVKSGHKVVITLTMRDMREALSVAELIREMKG